MCGFKMRGDTSESVTRAPSNSGAWDLTTRIVVWCCETEKEVCAIEMLQHGHTTLGIAEENSEK